MVQGARKDAEKQSSKESPFMLKIFSLLLCFSASLRDNFSKYQAINGTPCVRCP